MYLFHCKNTSASSNKTAAHSKSIDIFKWTKKSDYISSIENLLGSYYSIQHEVYVFVFHASPNALVGKTSTIVCTETLAEMFTVTKV